MVVHVLWEGLTHRGFHRGLIFDDDLFPIFCLKIGIDGVVVDFFIAFQNVLKHVVVEFQNHIGVHLDEAAIAIKGKAAVPGLGSQAFHRLIVQAQVQDRVHHAGHRSARARADRHQKRVASIAKTFAHGGLNRGHGCFDFIGQRIGVFLA